MFAAVFAAAAITLAPQDAPPPPPSEPVTLEEVTVTGRPLDTLIREFVTEVAEPNRGRGLARWHSRLCVGVVNLRAETAQHLVDRVSTVASDVGLDIGEPGCVPNLVIVATDDADGMANTLVEDHRRALRMGGSGMDAGGRAARPPGPSTRPKRYGAAHRRSRKYAAALSYRRSEHSGTSVHGIVPERHFN